MGSGNTHLRRVFVALVVGSFLFAVLVVGAVPARADNNSDHKGIVFHVGDEFIAGLGLPMGDVSRAENGDTILVIGTGDLDVEGHSAGGHGTFEHRSSDGTLIAFGTWKAKMLVSFDNFGSQSDVPPNFNGGRALIIVRVIAHPATNPSATLKFDATLTVDCRLGNFPPGFEEGITFSTGLINFNVKDPVLHGFTLFVADD